MAAPRRSAGLPLGAPRPEQARVYQFRVTLDKSLRDWLVTEALLTSWELGNKTISPSHILHRLVDQARSADLRRQGRG
jgi:hypothetical protein